MKQTILSLLLVVLATLGILDAGYITYEKLTGATPVCRPGFDCGEVLNSPWASIGPIPLSLLGLLYYMTVFSLGIINYMQVDIKKLPIIKKILIKGKPLTIKQIIMGVTTFGFIFSMYLVSLMAFIIQAWCLYCLFSAMTSSLLFVTAILITITNKPKLTANSND